MTEEQKNNLITKMLESPAALSDTEIMQILEDEELRDIYSLSVDIKAAKENQTEINPSAEWNMFRLKLVKPRRWNFGLFYRVAAILVGVLLVSAGIFYLTNKETSKPESKFAQNDKPDVEDTKITEQAIVSVQEEDNDLQVTPKLPRKPKSVKISQPQNAENPQAIDVEEYIRIEQARMDNDLAMQRAEAVVNRYYAMAVINEAMQSDLGDGYSMEDEIVTLIIP